MSWQKLANRVNHLCEKQHGALKHAFLISLIYIVMFMYRKSSNSSIWTQMWGKEMHNTFRPRQHPFNQGRGGGRGHGYEWWTVAAKWTHFLSSVQSSWETLCAVAAGTFWSLAYLENTQPRRSTVTDTKGLQTLGNKCWEVAGCCTCWAGDPTPAW